MTRPTPETDNEAFEAVIGDYGKGEFVPAPVSRKLERERDEAREAMAWRPIESAPKDGSRVFLYGDPARRVIGFWDDIDGDWAVPLGFKWTATHWMPLPQPPEARSREGGEM